MIKFRFFYFDFDSSLSVINEPLPDVTTKSENFYAQRFGGSLFRLAHYLFSSFGEKNICSYHTKTENYGKIREEITAFGSFSLYVSRLDESS